MSFNDPMLRSSVHLKHGFLAQFPPPPPEHDRSYGNINGDENIFM